MAASRARWLVTASRTGRGGKAEPALLKWRTLATPGVSDLSNGTSSVICLILRLTPQDRPFADGSKPATGLAPQAVTVLSHHILAKQAAHVWWAPRQGALMTKAVDHSAPTGYRGRRDCRHGTTQRPFRSAGAFNSRVVQSEGDQVIGRRGAGHGCRVGGVYVAAANARAEDVPAGASVIDCAGGTVTAGFWNSHVHFTGDVFRAANTAPSESLAAALRAMLTSY